MSDPYFSIVMAAAELKKAAPAQYAKFVEAFKVLEDRTKSDLIASEANVIYAAQGKAWLVVQLRTKLEGCIALADTYEKRK